MKRLFLILNILLTISFDTNAEQLELMVYDAPGEKIKVDLPSNWKLNRRNELTFEFSRSKGAPMKVLLTAFPIYKGKGNDVTSKSMAEDVAKHMAPGSEIPTLPVKLLGADGAYSDAVDKAPKPGEYKYFRQFILKRLDLSIITTVLSNEEHEAIQEEALKLMRSLELTSENTF